MIVTETSLGRIPPQSEVKNLCTCTNATVYIGYPIKKKTMEAGGKRFNQMCVPLTIALSPAFLAASTLQPCRNAILLLSVSPWPS